MSKPSTTLGLFVTLSGAWEENVTLDFATQAMDDIAVKTSNTGTCIYFQDHDDSDLAFWRPNPA